MAFNLAEVLGNVSNLGTGKEQIEYIDIDLIDEDSRNFYELSGIDELAANIELFGLQQPVRVRSNPDDSSRVIIVSGHRRRAAMRLLVDEGKTQYREVPCIREQGESSAALQELRLIYANSDTRKMTSAELSKQAERVEALLYQLKEEGVEFPGRMRDHVAEACQVSKSKLARLKVIRENLTPFFMKLYEKNKLKEAVAYEVARLPQKYQAYIECHQNILSSEIQWWSASTPETYGKRMAAIDKLKCKGGDICSNREPKYAAALNQPTWRSDTKCAKCCSKCDSLASCKYACPKLAEKVKQLKADAKAQRAQEKLARAEKNAPTIAQIRDLWTRFALARRAAGVSVKSYYKALDRYWEKTYTEKFEAMEAPDAKLKVDSDLPYGNMGIWTIQRLVKAADCLDCSIDYLLLRTDDPKPKADAPAEGWLPLQWIDGHERPTRVGQKAVAVFEIPGLKNLWERIGTWNGTAWEVDRHPLDEKCVRWFPIPEDE